MPGRYFGYGSLVNPDARMADRDFQKARLRGWRRSWSLSGEFFGGRVCGLTIERAEGGEIEGIVATRASADWADLDARERRYDRTPVAAEEVAGVHPEGLQVYIAKPDARMAAAADNQFLQSYCDCVMQGYLREFGEAGLEAFVASTAHWTPGAMRLDRDEPIYQRAVRLTADEAARIDAIYARLGLI